MKAREGDLIQTHDNVIFDVKGLVHPPHKIIAFPRYIPTQDGTRNSGENKYNKVYNLAERFKYLKQNTPQFIVFDPVFGENLCEVPINSITKHYKPTDKLAQLREAKNLADLERRAVSLAESLKKTADIPWSSIGISGSIMAGLFTPRSDIDLLIYGMKNCRKAYTALKRLLKDEKSLLKPYSQEELETLFGFRSKDTNMIFEDFIKVESRKAFQGKFDGIDYFIRFVKDWNEETEKYGSLCYKNSGYAKIITVVSDDSEALFTPCTYKLEDIKMVKCPYLNGITEVVSFRGRFCEQASKGERIMVQGKVEQVKNNRNNTEHYRIIIGNKPSDYMVLLET